MKISETKYQIVTKQFLIELLSGTGTMESFDGQSMMSKEKCEDLMIKCENPENFETVKVTLTYEF